MNLPDQGLQLGWTGKTAAQRVARQTPFHALEPVSTHGTPGSGNLLVQGDNLLALKALMPFYKGRVKCIFIDPPYNTGSAFEHYDDKLEHSQWLSMMYPRLMLLHDLLSEDGFIVFHIDDAESHYAKVLLDEVFGRSNYQTSIYVQVRYTSKTLKTDMAYHKQIEQALVYRRSWGAKPYKPSIKKEGFEKFNFDITELAEGRQATLGGKAVQIFKPGEYDIKKVDGYVDGLKEIWATGSILDGNSSGRFFRDYLAGRIAEDGVGALYKVADIGDDGLGYRYLTGPKKASATKGKYFQGVPMEKRSLEIQDAELPIENFYDFSPQFGNCRNEGGVDFRSGKKPEAYVKKMLDLFSRPGDLILDSFLGSGTTAAVAHKTGRKYIGIEMKDQANTHCVPRLITVINGDRTGVSAEVNWQGGGGFQFMRLGPAIFTAQKRIAPDVGFAALAALVWHVETGQPADHALSTALLGVHAGTACYLLYNGVLGDKRPEAGNVLTESVYRHLMATHPHSGPAVVYGEATNLGPARRAALQLSFKQLPYDLKQLQGGVV